MHIYIDCICLPLFQCVFQMCPHSARLRLCIFTLIAFVCFYSSVGFKFVLTVPVSDYACLLWLHLFAFIPVCVSNLSPIGMPAMIPNFTGCIYLTFYHCMFSNEYNYFQDFVPWLKKGRLIDGKGQGCNLNASSQCHSLLGTGCFFMF